jgi:hypothetical protein
MLGRASLQISIISSGGQGPGRSFALLAITLIAKSFSGCLGMVGARRAVP